MLAFGFLWWNYAKAERPKEKIEAYYFDYQEQTIQNTGGIPAEKSWDDFVALEEKVRADQKKRLETNKKLNQGGSCVAFAKKYLGIDGVWGDGGRKLSLNSDPEVNSIVIFSYTHVAVITAINESTYTLIESNMDLKGTISTRTILKTDKTIIGFHKF